MSSALTRWMLTAVALVMPLADTPSAQTGPTVSTVTALPFVLIDGSGAMSFDAKTSRLMEGQGPDARPLAEVAFVATDDGGAILFTSVVDGSRQIVRLRDALRPRNIILPSTTGGTIVGGIIIGAIIFTGGAAAGPIALASTLGFLGGGAVVLGTC